METAQYTLGILAISQLVFMGLFFLIHHYRQLLGQLFTLFSVCLASYILSSLSVADTGSPFAYILSRLTSATPAVLWIISRYLFVDENRIPPLAWFVIAYYLIARALGGAIYTAGQPGSEIVYFLCFILPQLIMLALALHTVYTALRGLNADLVEERRRVRVPFVISMGTLVAMVVGSGFFLSSDPILADLFFFSLEAMPNGLYFSYIFLVILAFNLALFRLPEDALELISSDSQPPEAAPAETQVSPGSDPGVDPELVRRIQSLIEEDRLYTETGLTIGGLAARIPIQEYRLRRIINQQLGYRNFNQFLNKFRIREATRRLNDPAEAGVSISTIAFEAGYSALSSFNKAFRETHNQTPSQYRSAPAENGRAEFD